MLKIFPSFKQRFPTLSKLLSLSITIIWFCLRNEYHVLMSINLSHNSFEFIFWIKMNTDKQTQFLESKCHMDLWTLLCYCMTIVPFQHHMSSTWRNVLLCRCCCNFRWIILLLEEGSVVCGRRTHNMVWCHRSRL